MARWTIYGKNGAAKAVVDSLELHDEWMAECFVTLSITSHEPIEFAIGDYLDYRGERYTINYDPSVLKKARKDTYGEGFVYENIKFVAVQDEIVRCDFTDIVLSDNNIHYTMLPTFPFYCETVDDLLDRIQANLEELYPGDWIIISPMLERDRQRGLCVGRESAFVEAYNEYIGGGSFSYDKTGVSITADNINCWEALKHVNDSFGLNFIVRGRVVIVGTVGMYTSRNFRYGKGNGLYEMERISDSEQRIITRMRGYGAETNLPTRFYATLDTLPFAVVDSIRESTTEDKPFIDFNIDLTGTAYWTYQAYLKLGNWTDEQLISGTGYIVTMKCGGYTAIGRVFTGYGLVRIYMEYSDTDDMTPAGVPVSVRDWDSAVGFINAVHEGVHVYFFDRVKVGAFDKDHLEGESALPDNMAINRLMLPGFPTKSLARWVEEHHDDPRIQEIIADGFTFSNEQLRPYIDSPNKEYIGLRPGSVYFDGSDENEDIHPTMEGMEWEGKRCDVILEAGEILDNGVLADDAKETDRQVRIVLPYSGFELDELKTDETTVEMKDGMCGARSLKVVKVVKDKDGNWECTCERDYDDVLHLYFPYCDFQIHAGDHYVLTGVELPKSYVDAASEKLFYACVEALRQNHAPRFTFQPRIDEIWMARQHDAATAAHQKSLHDTLKAGDIFVFTDEDLGIDGRIIIDILIIKENGNNGIPTYEVTLRDEKVTSTIEKRLDKVTSAVNAGLGGGGGYSGRQTGSLIESLGSQLFLSKIYDDEAQGLIGFLKGAWFGAKEWIIDNLGNANLKNVTVNGILRALNSYINKVRSTNYSGDGMLDTGWQIINDYEGSNSKAVFDYLYIRKKAVFEELEIRKLSHIGGNFCLSPASGRVWRVELYDSEVGGNLLGYSEVTVPYTLGGTMLSLFRKLYGRITGQEQGRYLLGRKKMIARKLTPQEIAAAKRIRVYMFTDDGTTKTMQNWTVGAQARCQTFNIEEQMSHISGGESDNPDVEYWTGTKVQNHYWWRLVTAIGEGLCDDGKVHSYIEFLQNQTNQRTHSDAGSDIPEVGDEFGQFGHRTRSDQSNVIMIETANDDSPAMKFYHGINSWNLNGKRPIILSPTLVEMRASMFRWITSYGDETGQVTKRGLWVNITVDSAGNRRCYPNDVVSHNGTMWRCIVASGSHKEDANGNWLTQAQVDAMTLEQQMALTEVENYTIQEPSDLATDWVEYTDEAIAAYIKFSEALIAVPCEKDRKATDAVNKTITAKLMVTNLEATITSITVEGADAYVYRSGNNIIVNIPKNTTITNKDYIVTIEGDCMNNHYIATDKISVFAAVRGNDAYEVHATPSQWIWNQEGANMSREEIIRAIEDGTQLTFHIQIDKVELLDDGVTMGNSCAQITVMNDGDIMPFIINSVSTSEAHIGTNYNNTTGRVWVTSIPDTLESGWVDVNITYGDNANLTVRIPFYCNLLGTWREQIIGDTRVAIANRTQYLDDEYTSFHAEYVQSSSENSAHFQRIDTSITNLQNADNTISQNLEQAKSDLGNSISTAQSTLQASIDATNTALATAEASLAGDINTVSVNLATYEQTADAQIAALTTRVSNNETSITNTNTRVDTAEGSIQTLTSQMDGTTDSGLKTSITNTNTRISTAEGNIQTVQSAIDNDVIKKTDFVQNANGYTLMNYQIPDNGYVEGEITDLEEEVYNNLTQVGISVDGEQKSISLYADKIAFYRADTTPANISVDAVNDTFRFGDFFIDKHSTSHTKSGVSYISNVNDGNGSNVLLEGDGSLYLYNRGSGQALNVTGYGGSSITSTNDDIVLNGGNRAVVIKGAGTAVGLRIGQGARNAQDVPEWKGIQYTKDGGTNWINLINNDGSISTTIPYTNVTGKPSLTIGNTTKQIADGTTTFTAEEIGIITGNYLPLSGGTLSGTIRFIDNVGIEGAMGGGTDYWAITGSGTDDNGRLKIIVGDNATTDYIDFEFRDWSGPTYTPLSMTGNSVIMNGTVTVNGNSIIDSSNIGLQTVANATNCLPLAGGTMTGRIYLPLGQKLQWASNDADVNSYGTNWYGLGGYQVVQSGMNVEMLALSNYWGINLIAKDDSSVYINGNTIVHSGNIASQSVNYANSANFANYVYCSSHIGSWRLSSDWDGSYFWLTAKNGSDTLPCATSYATSAGTASSATYATSAGSADYATAAGKLTGIDSYYSMWGLKFFENGIPKDVSGCADMGNGLKVGYICIECSSDKVHSGYGNEINDFHSALALQYSNNNGVQIGSSTYASNQLTVYGGIYVYGYIYGTGAVSSLSDIRYKNVLRHFALDVETIANASIIQFTWREGADTKPHVGGIAQEWQAFLPEAVSEDKDGRLSMDYGVIAYTEATSLARKVVEQQREIDDLKERLARLERLLERRDAETQRD